MAKKRSGASTKGSAAATKNRQKAARRRAPRKALDAEARGRLLRVRESHDESVPIIARAWAANREIRVEGLTPKRLVGLSAAAEKKRAKENDVRAVLQARLAPAIEARMLAEDALQRGASA